MLQNIICLLTESKQNFMLPNTRALLETEDSQKRTSKTRQEMKQKAMSSRGSAIWRK